MWNRGVLFAIVAAGVAIVVYSATDRVPTARAGNAPTPVVVELFTSEGCSSCPPADALLMELDKQPIAGAEVIALGQHVDYWDRLGWRDRFSSHQFTERQSQYSSYFRLESIYTPQMVVDGRKEFVGNSRSDAFSAIQGAAKAAKPVSVKLEKAGADAVKIDVSETQPTGRSVVYLAITEGGIESNVGSGENSGRKLHHAAVVHSLKKLGELENGAFHATQKLGLNRDWNLSQSKAVVFVQNEDHGQIVGAASLALN